MSERLTVDKINSAIGFLEISAIHSHDAALKQNCLVAIQALIEKKNRIGAQERFTGMVKGNEYISTSAGCLGVQITLSDLEI